MSWVTTLKDLFFTEEFDNGLVKYKINVELLQEDQCLTELDYKFQIELNWYQQNAQFWFF